MVSQDKFSWSEWQRFHHPFSSPSIHPHFHPTSLPFHHMLSYNTPPNIHHTSPSPNNHLQHIVSHTHSQNLSPKTIHHSPPPHKSTNHHPSPPHKTTHFHPSPPHKTTHFHHPFNFLDSNRNFHSTPSSHDSQGYTAHNNHSHQSSKYSQDSKTPNELAGKNERSKSGLRNNDGSLNLPQTTEFTKIENSRDLKKTEEDGWKERSLKEFQKPSLTFEDFLSHPHFFHPYLFLYRYNLFHSLQESNLKATFAIKTTTEKPDLWERGKKENEKHENQMNPSNNHHLNLTNHSLFFSKNYFLSPTKPCHENHQLTQHNHHQLTHKNPHQLTQNNHQQLTQNNHQQLTQNHHHQLTQNNHQQLTQNNHHAAFSDHSSIPSFLSPSSLSEPSRTPTRFHCEACNKSYSTYNGLFKHKELHCASLSRKTHTCPHCQLKSYATLGALKMHIKTHTLPCKCKHCGKAFSRPWLLRGHLRTHTGEKPFKCVSCSRAFADKSNLRAHQQTHSNAKKHHCVNCEKTFSRMSLFLKHKLNQCCL